MLKRYVSLGGLSSSPRSPFAIGLSFMLLVLVGSGVFLSSLVSRQQHAHAAKPATTIVGGVSKTWYFAEGQVGAGFREFITISNPDPTKDCTATITYMPEGDLSSAQAKTHQAARKPLNMRTVTIAHNSRYTASVNQDLGITETQQPGLQHSTMVSVPFVSGCAGVVVERPMYFNYHGVTSGSDVMGTTSLAQTFYFADVPTQAGASSFMQSHFTVLNPSQTDVASITVNYSAAGSVVQNQTLYIAPGARGTIDPGTLPYPHVAAVVTSNLAVVVERSSYFHNVHAEVAGTVTSAASVVGAQLLSNSWHFAEGYTGGQTQEKLLLSNPTNSATTATVTLEYQNTHHQVLTLPVPAYTQVPVDVNSANAQPTGTCDVIPCVTTPEVSAEVTATDQSLVVERQMFFHYTHTIPGTSIATSATGGTEVQGTLTPATSVANFAEGYTNVGYNEWLTLQNPMGTDETLALRVVNEYGQVYTQSVLVKAKSRSTVDITALVLQHLVQKGDDYRGYQVSMGVQVTTANSVFVAERPMYFSLSGSIQGGTDVVGFTGTYSCTDLSTALSRSDSIDFMTTGPDGNLWVAEYEINGNKIAKITPFGVTTEYTIPTTNSSPGGITLGPDGNLWFTETIGSKIGKITTAGVISEYPLTANSRPHSIVKGADGNLWFVEQGNSGKIGKITTNGIITEYSAPNATNADGITLGPDGNVWFGEGTADKIARITLDGTVTEYSTGITAGANIDRLTTGADGNVWFIENSTNKIGRITTSGTVGIVTEYSTGITANSDLQAITTGADGNLWFTQPNPAQIGIITPTGVVTELNVSASVAAPAAIAVGPDSNIWFSDYASSGQIGRCSIAA